MIYYITLYVIKLYYIIVYSMLLCYIILYYIIFAIIISGDGVEPEPRELGTMVRRANAKTQNYNINVKLVKHI